MVPVRACWVLQSRCLVRKGWREELWVWSFVLIYSVVLGQDRLPLGLRFIFSKKAMAVLVLPDHPVPEKQKHTHAKPPSFIEPLEGAARG